LIAAFQAVASEPENADKFTDNKQLQALNMLVSAETVPVAQVAGS
jgi:hypothetical protein